MKKILFFTLFLLILYCSPEYSMAHPGNTDSSGGHTCRTNCEDWGLDYGEYHYHDDTGESETSNDQDDYDEGYQRGYDDAYGYTSQCIEDYEWSWEGPQAFGDGYEDGIDDGHQDGLAECESTNEMSESLDEYNNAKNGISPEQTTSDEEINVEEVSAEDDYEFYEEKKEETNYIPYAIGGGAGIFVIGYFIGKRRKSKG